MQFSPNNCTIMMVFEEIIVTMFGNLGSELLIIFVTLVSLPAG